jgi:hypothetical protein
MRKSLDSMSEKFGSKFPNLRVQENLEDISPEITITFKFAIQKALEKGLRAVQKVSQTIFIRFLATGQKLYFFSDMENDTKIIYLLNIKVAESGDLVKVKNSQNFMLALHKTSITDIISCIIETEGGADLKMTVNSKENSLVLWNQGFTYKLQTDINQENIHMPQDVLNNHLLQISSACMLRIEKRVKPCNKANLIINDTSVKITKSSDPYLVVNAKSSILENFIENRIKLNYENFNKMRSNLFSDTNNINRHEIINYSIRTQIDSNLVKYSQFRKKKKNVIHNCDMLDFFYFDFSLPIGTHNPQFTIYDCTKFNGQIIDEFFAFCKTEIDLVLTKEVFQNEEEPVFHDEEFNSKNYENIIKAKDFFSSFFAITSSQNTFGETKIVTNEVQALLKNKNKKNESKKVFEKIIEADGPSNNFDKLIKCREPLVKDDLRGYIKKNGEEKNELFSIEFTKTQSNEINKNFQPFDCYESEIHKNDMESQKNNQTVKVQITNAPVLNNKKKKITGDGTFNFKPF